MTIGAGYEANCLELDEVNDYFEWSLDDGDLYPCTQIWPNLATKNADWGSGNEYDTQLPVAEADQTFDSNVRVPGEISAIPVVGGRLC